MALINCPDCNKEVSSNAPACPGCGAPIQPTKKEPKQFGLGASLLIVVFGLFVLSMIFSDKSEEDAKPKTTADIRKEQLKKCFSDWDGSHRNLEKVVKASMNDADSYDHKDTIYRDKGDYLIVTTTFTGKNAFGGTVKNSVTAKTDLNCSVVEVISQ